MSATRKKPVGPGEKADRLNVRFRSEGATKSRTIGWMADKDPADGQLFLILSARCRPVFGVITAAVFYNRIFFLTTAALLFYRKLRPHEPSPTIDDRSPQTTCRSLAEYVHAKERLIVRPHQEICYSYVCACFVVRVFANKRLSCRSSPAAPVLLACTSEVFISVSG